MYEKMYLLTCANNHIENTPIQIYRKFQPQKLKIFRWKTLIFFHISAQNIDCGYSLEPPRRGGSNEYPQSMFLSRNKKHNAYPCKSQFYYIKVGFNSKLCRYVFLMCLHEETLHCWLPKMRQVKILIRRRECAGWSDSLLGAHVQSYVFWHAAQIYTDQTITSA